MTNSLQLDSQITLIPVVHGSASYTMSVRRFLLEQSFDCLAVPLPESFREAVLAGVDRLPAPSIAIQVPDADKTQVEHAEDEDADDAEDNPPRRFGSYVPIDPCQAVIASIRFALSERIAIEFVDMEESQYIAPDQIYPDPMALQFTSIERFCAAVMPMLRSAFQNTDEERILEMAHRIHRLRDSHRRIIVLCSIEHWPWLREALRTLENGEAQPAALREDAPPPAVPFSIDPRTLLFLFCELPFITGLYERAAKTLEVDSDLAIDGIKELMLSARQSYIADLGKRARKITPLLISQCLKFVRNQTLLERRLAPSFYSLVRSAQQIMGDQFAVHLVEASNHYPFDEEISWPMIKMGIGKASLPDIGVVTMQNRLQGSLTEWKNLELKRPALKIDKHKWSMQWNPYRQCSWPEEDVRIESFRNRVIDRARAAIGADLARSEKFSTSMMDGIDLRETLRHWYDGGLYVKVQPPSIGQLDAAVMLFDSEPDPREYSWRATWFAEHEDESTLAFYATPFEKEMVGPGVALSNYGGALFLYPPRPIADIWEDPRLDFADTLEQRLVAAACLHAQARHIALMSIAPPGLALKKIAKLFKKQLVHIPLSHFGDSVIQQLRSFHVLNGTRVRSYAAHFIRKP